MDLMHHTCLREYTAGMKMVSPPVAKGAVGDRPAPVKASRPAESTCSPGYEPPFSLGFGFQDGFGPW